MAIATPSGPDATSTSRYTATLSWTNEAEYTDIVIGVYSDSYPSVHYETIDGADEEWVDTGLNDNDTTYYFIRGEVHGEESAWTEEVYTTAHYSLDTNTTAVTQSLYQTVQSPGAYSNTVIDYAQASESITSQSVMATTDTNTTAVWDYNESSQTIKTNYCNYLGLANGDICEYSTSKHGDGSYPIVCQWESKDTDFGDQDPRLTDRNKTVWAIKLHYEDLEEATFTVGISTDGGATWTTVNKTVGSGTERAASKTFHFHKTGQRFKFRVQHTSASETFKLTGMEIEYEDAGEHWDVG